MKRLLIFGLLFFIFSIKSRSQENVVIKRTAFTLKINVDKERFYEEEIGATPYNFPNNGMQIYPSETIYVEVEQSNGTIINMKAVSEIKKPEITLIIKFSQKSEKKIHQMMMLEIHNPFAKDLIYDTKIFLLKTKKWVDTDVFPVRAKLSAFETWPDVIISLCIGNWKFSDK